MNKNTVTDLYRNIMELDKGVRVIKADLHIHSPASKCFKSPPGMVEEDVYTQLLDEAIAAGIEIIAIADHNTFQGFNKISKRLNSSNSLRKKYRNVLVLCGIEITCYSNHLLAIFDKDFAVEKQNQFLHEIGIDYESQGKEDALADELGPPSLLRKISEYGGISILAHADAEKGFFYALLGNKSNEIAFKGKSLERIVKSPSLYGIQVCSEKSICRIAQILNNKNYRREDRSLPFLLFSDAHGLCLDGKYSGNSGKQIGSATTKMKLSHKSFSALKLALADSDTRIIKEGSQAKYPAIIGCAIKSDIIKSDNSEYACFRFSEQLNCIIGSRGTGKSTLLGIIRDVLEYETFFPEDSNYRERYSAAIVFISYHEKIFAVSSDFWANTTRAVYVKENSKNVFRPYKDSVEFLALYLTKTYNQGQLYEYHVFPNKVMEIIDSFVMWKHHAEYGDCIQTVKRLTDEVMLLFKPCFSGNKSIIKQFKDEELETVYQEKYNEIQKAHDKITELRTLFVEQINKILDGKIKLKITYELNGLTHSFLTSQLPQQVARKAGRYFDYEVHVKKFMTSVIERSKLVGIFPFFALLITGQMDKIFDGLQIEITKKNIQFLNDIKNSVEPATLLLFLENGMLLEYNVNAGIPKSTPVFRESTKLSLGQNAVAMLLIILTASQDLDDNRPLLMDQPEDDLDNTYIYSTLVEEFRRSKNKRQLIISTHNANIPVAADAENILVLQYNGEHGFMESNGSLDNPIISDAVLNILEGGEMALKSRNDKYKNIVDITK